MRSMTGFGVASVALTAGTLRLELRALNHRYQDVRVRTPPELAELNFFIEQTARQKLGRGRYDVSVRLETGEADSSFDKQRVREVYRALCELRDELAPGSDVPLSAALTLPETNVPHSLEDELARQSIAHALDEALDKLTEMREREGAALTVEIRKRIERLRRLVQEVSAGSAELVQQQRARLQERVGRLLADSEVTASAERLEQEIAILADKSDITEELVRLASHFDQLSQLTEESTPVGRRFDFLLQEVGREVNTIGSKSQHAPVAHLVVDMKAEVERLREQVQNVE